MNTPEMEWDRLLQKLFSCILLEMDRHAIFHYFNYAEVLSEQKIWLISLRLETKDAVIGRDS